MLNKKNVLTLLKITGVIDFIGSVFLILKSVKSRCLLPYPILLISFNIYTRNTSSNAFLPLITHMKYNSEPHYNDKIDAKTMERFSIFTSSTRLVIKLSNYYLTKC